MKILKLSFTPLSAPVILFAILIVIGTILLHLPISHIPSNFSWTDALFTATSATCVTGLAVVDTGTFFTDFGQTVILCLIQFGGLGIMTYTSLIFYLLNRRVSLTDRIAIGDNLLHNHSFKLSRFLIQVILCSLCIEMAGALLLYIQEPQDFSIYSSIFHSISAFCNAGFSLNSDNLIKWQGNWGIKLIFMALIWSGGIGSSVLLELISYLKLRICLNKKCPHPKLSWYAHTIIYTSFFLIIAGWLGLYFSEFMGLNRNMSTNNAILSALFQSVSCRTAGFNSLAIEEMTNVSLLLLIMLMFIGGASGSCAGGIKISTFRIIIASIISQIKGAKQSVIGKFAVDNLTLNKSLALLTISVFIIIASTLALNITEGGNVPHSQARGISLEIVFEAVSAYGTVGLSMGFTSKLSWAGRLIITMLMFIGRLGPITIIAAIQSYQKQIYYAYPEENMLVG